jgi:adenine-specific DNA-methyltransferase
MQLIQTPVQLSLNPAFRKLKPNREEIELFKHELIQLLDRIKENESEEYHKNLVIDFLNSTYYKNNYYINTKGRSDLVIHNGKEPNSPVGVLMEAKKPTNKSEMISKDNVNVKSFQELVLYYLRERKTQKNFQLRYLIITNIYEWYIFDAQTFEKLFYENKKLVSDFEEFEAGSLTSKNTDFFYKEIAAPAIQKITQDVACTYLNLNDYQKPLRNTDKSDDKKLIPLFKLLSPVHLLKLPFANDNNTLNKDFYAELLHIIGLEETKDGGKSVIGRKKEGSRDGGSLVENAIEKIDVMDKLSRINRVFQPGTTIDEKLYNISLDLSITWINRILFLKLLESQLLKYQNGNKVYRFLSIDLIKNFDDLDNLFFQVLARKTDERRGESKVKFSHVPYLNSSLFEPTELEHEAISIGNLQDSLHIKLYPKSILKDKKGKLIATELPPLEYLFRFLDAYDFSSEGYEEIQEENKTLISASVLGLIFEKINGYKDGSFFTPSFITMYMCRETISLAILQKFKEKKGWECNTLVDLHNKIENINEANSLINSIKICDPAVGSGHFLVSALNEIIAIKSELGILCDRNGKLLRGYKTAVVNDELIISENEIDFFRYIPGNHESQRVQETLFHEKQSIIENSLFGVDLNPNSVKICQLRLWIELLKNAYYKAGTTELETLPNIDINIKCGNSLISRYALDEDLSLALKASGYTVEQYREAVNRYRNADSKEEKHAMYKLIESIKRNLKTEINKRDKNVTELLKLKKELSLKTAPTLFERSAKEEKIIQKNIIDIKAKIAKYEAIIDEIKNNRMFENALEWRFEFPEVLNEDGEYIGFNAIIGNPPYIQLQKLGEMADAYQKMNYATYERTGDIYCLFYELGNTLLRKDYFLSFITSNKWMRAGYGESMRRYFVENTNPKVLIDFSGQKIFDEATVDVNILMLSKAEYDGKTQSCIVKESCIENMSGYIQLNSTMNNCSSNSWIVLTDIERRIKEKIEKVGTPLKDWDIQINYGIKTGFNDAFIIDSSKRKELIEKHSKSEEIIRPILRGRDIKRYKFEFPNSYMLALMPSKHYNIDDYPVIKEHLLSFGYKRLNQSGEVGSRKKTNNKWFELQDSISYFHELEKPKIIWGEISDKPKFTIDENGYCYPEATTFFLTGEHLQFLLCYLNSRLSEYLFSQIGTTTGVGTIRWKKYTIEQLNVPPKSLISNYIFDELSKEIKKSYSIDLEMKVNKIIYELFDLNEEEIAFIENYSSKFN